MLVKFKYKLSAIIENAFPKVFSLQFKILQSVSMNVNTCQNIINCIQLGLTVEIF